MSSMVFISLISLSVMCLTIDCNDLCSALKPDGHYSGVKDYLRYNHDIEEVWMTNKNDIEWRVDITSE